MLTTSGIVTGVALMGRGISQTLKYGSKLTELSKSVSKQLIPNKYYILDYNVNKPSETFSNIKVSQFKLERDEPIYVGNANVHIPIGGSMDTKKELVFSFTHLKSDVLKRVQGGICFYADDKDYQNSYLSHGKAVKYLKNTYEFDLTKEKISSSMVCISECFPNRVFLYGEYRDNKFVFSDAGLDPDELASKLSGKTGIVSLFCGILILSTCALIKSSESS